VVKAEQLHGWLALRLLTDHGCALAPYVVGYRLAGCRVAVSRVIVRCVFHGAAVLRAAGVVARFMPRANRSGMLKSSYSNACDGGLGTVADWLVIILVILPVMEAVGTIDAVAAIGHVGLGMGGRTFIYVMWNTGRKVAQYSISDTVGTVDATRATGDTGRSRDSRTSRAIMDVGGNIVPSVVVDAVRNVDGLMIRNVAIHAVQGIDRNISCDVINWRRVVRDGIRSVVWGCHCEATEAS